MEEKELTPGQKALGVVSTKEYQEEYTMGFKALAKMKDEMLNGEFDDEEEVVGVNALDVPCFVLHNQGFLNGYEAASNDCNTWISCLDRIPDPSEHKRVIVHRVSNASQKDNAISIVDASIIKHCNKEETHWLPLPKFE